MKEHEMADEKQLPTTRVDGRKKAKQRNIKRVGWIVFVLLFLFIVSVTIMKGYGILKNEMGKEVAIRHFEQALREKDWNALKTSIRSTIPINEKTLAPLLSYLDKYPEGYEMLHRDLEKQKETKHVYIKGLTSVPPIFTMAVYETQFFLLDQYVFEPALYSFVIRTEADITVFVNGEKVEGEATKEPFVKKYGPYLPGMYEVVLIENEKKRTKTVILFGGKRLKEVKF